MSGRRDPAAILAIDAGSSRTRASLVAVDDGSVLSSAVASPRSAGGELDPDGLWRDAARLVASLDLSAADVLAIAVAAQLGTVLVDESGTPIRPAMLWGDVRAQAEASALVATFGEAAIMRIGRPLAAELPVAKLRWLVTHEQGALARTRWMLSLKDFLVLRLSGRAITDETHASYSGCFDVRGRTWARALAADAGIDPRLLPPTAAGAAVAGELTRDAARATSLPTGLPIAVGGPDGTLGAVGSGAVRAGITVDVAGTTDVLVHTLDAPPDGGSSAVVVNAHVVPGLWTVGGPTGLTGGAVEWAAQLLGYDSASAAYASLGDAVEEAAAEPDLPLFVPALGGSRFPTWRADATGSLTDLRPSHGPAHVLRAVQEGVAFTVGAGLDAIRGLGIEPTQVVLVGGAAARRATLQLRSDAWGIEVVAPANREATTIGAAMLGGVAAGAYSDLAAAATRVVRLADRADPRRGELARTYARWRAAEALSYRSAEQGEAT